MLDEHALRYLVIRQIWTLRDIVPPDEYDEVTRSLAVARDKTSFIVTWSKSGQRQEKRIPRETFVFYRKGDRPDAEGVVGNVEKTNLHEARALALELLGRPEQFHFSETVKNRVRPAELIAFLWSGAFCFVLALAGTGDIPIFAALLAVALWMEYVPRYGQVLAACILVAISSVGPPATGMVLAVMYAVTQFLDPNRFWRELRIGIAVVAAVTGATMLTRQLPETGSGDIALALVLLLGMIVAGMFRWTVGSHIRMLPILIGLTAPALALETHTVPALIVAGNAIVCLAARMWGWRAFAHPNAATYQGVSRVGRQ